jgi:putative hemin transport protein
VIVLSARWEALRAVNPTVRIRDAADELGVSEAELLATTVGTTATRLSGDVAALVHALPSLGRCMALTRNAHAVSEVRGRYGGIELEGHVGQVVGDHIDLRLFLQHWRSMFAVVEPNASAPDGLRRSVHVFDAHGTAVHKVYVEPDGGDRDEFDALVRRFAAPPPAPPLAIEPAPRSPSELPDERIDVAALRTGWDAMRDTHDFFPLLRRLGATRRQALRLAGEDRARETTGDALARVLGEVSEELWPIMIFVGSRGCLQVYSGPVARVRPTGPWLNVLDPGFNLHLRADRIASSWVVTKPTEAGPIRSLELFDADGEGIALVFAKRSDRSKGEPAWWTELVSGLPEVRS